MASISVPCPKCSAIVRHGAAGRSSPAQQAQALRFSRPLSGFKHLPPLQVPSRSQFSVLKAQVKEVTIESSSNSVPGTSTKLETSSSSNKGSEVVEEPSGRTALSQSVISAYMADITDLVKLVDSLDIMEMQMKRQDYELVIRKKEALQQPPPASPVVMMQPPQQTAYPPPAAPSAPAAPPASVPALALPPPAKGSSSSHPPLKCPMAGTFYRCPGPGEPPFVKVGDKVKKGQVVCIIEAMKLMNEIEADQSGTLVEVLVEDGKPVSVDMPLFIIAP